MTSSLLGGKESQNCTGQKCTEYELVRRQFFNARRVWLMTFQCVLYIITQCLDTHFWKIYLKYGEAWIKRQGKWKKRGSTFWNCCLFFLVGNNVLVSDEQSNGPHEYGLLHGGGRAWDSAQDTIKLLTCFGISVAEGRIWWSFKTRRASLVVVFMKTIASHPYGHESLRLPIEGVLFQLTTCIIDDIWGVVIFEPVHDDFE